jgi:ACR3 family arsenite efflux pump ArsB
MGFFERYLTIWVLACIALGICWEGSHRRPSHRSQRWNTRASTSRWVC